MLLLSVSCSQNDPENAMVFHAVQQPRPRYVKLGLPVDGRKRRRESLRNARGRFSLCALVLRHVVLFANCHIPPFIVSFSV